MSDEKADDAVAASAPAQEHASVPKMNGQTIPHATSSSTSNLADTQTNGSTSDGEVPSKSTTQPPKNTLDPNNQANLAITDLPAQLPFFGAPTMTMEAPADGIVPAAPNGISNDEIALYDRQIRLWGMQAQQKIRAANILLITLRGLGTEIAKNLVLAGIGSLTVVDPDVVTPADFGSQFFLSEAEDDGHLGMNRAQAALPQIQKLNPRVTVMADPQPIQSKPSTFYGMFDMIIATDLDPDTLSLVNTSSRMASRPFYAAGVHGLYGFIFADLIEHTFTLQRDKSNVPTQIKPETRTRAVINVSTKKEGGKHLETVSKRELYSTWALAADLAPLPEEFLKSKRRLRAVTPTLSCLRALWQFQQLNTGRLPGRNSTNSQNDLADFTKFATTKHRELGLPTDSLKADLLRSFLQNIGTEIAPVTAMLGGQLAQDVINVLGQTQQPIQNMVVFDGNAMEASMYALHPEGLLGASQLGNMVAGLAMGGMNGMNSMNGMDGMVAPIGMPMMQDGSMDMSGAAMAMNGAGIMMPGMADAAMLNMPMASMTASVPITMVDGASTNGGDAGTNGTNGTTS